LLQSIIGRFFRNTIVNKTFGYFGSPMVLSF
jgi:hypothetical protein